MAERNRMTSEEVVRWLMDSDGADPVRESLRWMAEQLMEAEVSDLVGAELGERTEDRATHRNGYRPRRSDTRAGELELAIPKLRKGSYHQSRKARRSGLSCDLPVVAGARFVPRSDARIVQRYLLAA